MNFGYLIVVSTSTEVDYTQLAYALALSIKNTQKPGYDKVALVIDDPHQITRFNSTWVFDHVIPWDKETYWDGRSWMDQLSPFDETVCLDSDMLFLRDYSHWVDYFVENAELYVANKSSAMSFAMPQRKSLDGTSDTYSFMSNLCSNCSLGG